MKLGRTGRSVSLLAFLCTTACAHSGGTHDPESLGPYHLGADDLVEVYIFKNPDLSRTIPVRPDGHITMPLIGDVEVAGLTPQEARIRISARFRKWISDPNDIAVIVHEIHSTSIYVTGEVMKPGSFPLHAATTVLQAIAMAGGLGEFSARNDATVVRAGSGEKVVVSITDPADAGTLMLRPGDTVVVR
jgi:polysaccharide export outer membrane protein